MDEEVWDSAASRALEARPIGMKRLMMEEIASSIRVLKAVSFEQLEDENYEHETLVGALASSLGWLHRQIDMPRPSRQEIEEDINDTKLQVLKELLQVFKHWHNLQQSMQKAMSMRLWMLWMELGCTLEVLRYCEPVQKLPESYVQLMLTSQPPRDFPTSITHCNKEKQGLYFCELWDAVLAKPLHGSPDIVASEVAQKLTECFLYWMASAMRGYELAFIANVATPLQERIRAASNPLLVDGWIKFANINMTTGSMLNNAGGVAVTALVLSALTSANREPEVDEYLELLSAAAVDELSRGPFAQPHSSVGIVAMALGIAYLDDSSSSSFQHPGHATILCQFALLRLVSLKLLSPHLKPYDDATILNYQAYVHRSMRVLSNTTLQDISLRMTEACVEEMVGFYQSSFGIYLSLMEAMQSVLPEELFRTKMLMALEVTATADENLLLSPPDIVAFLKQFYGSVAPILEILSTGHLVRAFLALSRIEFVREVCASSTANASMQAVTQQLEQALEQTNSPPDAIFAPVLRSLAMHSMTASSEIPPEMDVVSGCQALAVGLVMQRKLRILLFQCTPLIDDALAVVFSGLYNVFEPVDAFSHRFLGVCLSHLSQFTPLFTVFPHYLQLTLAAYPANASPQDLTKACGATFGSLFYSEDLMMSSEQDGEVTETARRMVLWAIRKCCERGTELLMDEDEIAVPTTSTETIKEEAKPETDGLYLAGLVFELMKMAPMSVLKASAMEAEQLLARWKSNPRVLRELKKALFARISQNCEAEKRAWLAAWYIEIDNQYPVPESTADPATISRL
ncbi:hypothetical protein P3T76_014143 [Phytophthora citrophthora]|uniref:Uncharacterized protein n=1 Tax=Phytophthora citrophthora TaxID=4793 RepID=A0AAD9LCH6_9STRA|nr:hypothetical protein P3T76_014143 [Phytophthora citrophthora]